MGQVLQFRIFSKLCGAENAIAGRDNRICDLKPNRCAESIFLYGPTACGKSKLLEFLREVLGESATSALPLQSFGERFGKAQLKDKVANLVGEIPSDRIPTHCLDYFKALVGGDAIYAENKGTPAFYFRSKATLVFAGNCLPQFAGSDGSDALADRMVVLQFRKSIPMEERDRELLDKLLKERDHIISKCARRLMKLIRSDFKFAMGKDEEALLMEYKQTANTVKTFVENECTYDESSFCYISDAYDAYRDFAEEQALIPEKRQAFRTRMLADPMIYNAGKKRLEGGKPKACFGGIFLNNYDDRKQDTDL